MDTIKANANNCPKITGSAKKDAILLRRTPKSHE